MKRCLLLLGCAAICALVQGTSGVAVGTQPPRNDLLDRFLESATPRLVSYRARRTLEASSMGGRLRGSLEAVTYLNADGTFRFEVVQESGSSLIRERVLLAALRTEQETYERHELSSSELTRANYDFQVGPTASPNTVTLGLVPRRRSRMLLFGSAFVTDEGDLVRLEGRPAQLPSYWTRRVDVVCDYARLGGIRVTTAIRSRADVRIAGESTFSMTYAYAVINGKPVG